MRCQRRSAPRCESSAREVGWLPSLMPRGSGPRHRPRHVQRKGVVEDMEEKPRCQKCHSVVDVQQYDGVDCTFGRIRIRSYACSKCGPVRQDVEKSASCVSSAEATTD